jgi:hypothetical protein
MREKTGTGLQVWFQFPIGGSFPIVFIWICAILHGCNMGAEFIRASILVTINQSDGFAKVWKRMSLNTDGISNNLRQTKNWFQKLMCMFSFKRFSRHPPWSHHRAWSLFVILHPPLVSHWYTISKFNQKLI